MKIALIQTEVDWHAASTNRARFDKWFEGLEGGTDLVALPEMFNTGFTMHSSEVAEAMDGPTVTWMRERAVSHGVVIAGSLAVREGDLFFNRVIWAQPNGELASYDKRHCFRMAGEHENYATGNQRVILPLGGWRVCLAVCYDLRFPVWCRNRDDYDVLLCLANWPAVRQMHWSSLLRARAIENQCFSVGVNRVGTDGNDVAYVGGSGVYDFRGEVVMEIPERAQLLHIALDKPSLDEYRAAFPVWQDADQFHLED